MAAITQKPVFGSGRGWGQKSGGAKSGKGKRKAAAPRPDPRPIDDLLHLLPTPAHERGARVVLPYPPAILSPNARPDRYTLAKVKKSYSRVCWALALEAAMRVPDYADRGGTVFIHLDFFPPSATPPDDDNLEASFKAGRDGVASAMKCDDKRWKVSRTLHHEARSCVVLTVIYPGEAQARLDLSGVQS